MVVEFYHLIQRIHSIMYSLYQDNRITISQKQNTMEFLKPYKIYTTYKNIFVEVFDQNHQICGSYILLMKFDFFCKKLMDHAVLKNLLLNFQDLDDKYLDSLHPF